MEKEDIITKLSAYNFNEPVKVTVSFDDSDEEDNQSELLKTEEGSDPEKATKEKNRATDKHESTGTDHKQEVAEKIVISEQHLNSSIQSVKKEVQDLFSLIENYCSNGTVENETPNKNMAKKRKLENYCSKGTVDNETSDNNMDKNRKLETLQKETQRKNNQQKEIQQKDKEIQQKDKEIQQKDKEIQQRDKEIQQMDKEIQRKDNYQTSNSDITMKHVNNNLVHQNGQSTGTSRTTPNYENHNMENKSSTNKTTQKTNEERNTDSYIKNLLKSVSEHLILIVEAYHCYQRTVNDKFVAESLKKSSLCHYLRIKDHFFNLSYCTVATVIIPQETNLYFMRKFLSETINLSNNKYTYTQFSSILIEMLEWTRVKQKSLINLPIHFESASSQQHAHNSELKQNLAQPMQPLDSRVKHIDNINSSSSAYSSSTTSETFNSSHNGNYTIKQGLDQPPKPLHRKIEHYKNNSSNLSDNSSSTCYSSSTTSETINSSHNGNYTLKQHLDQPPKPLHRKIEHYGNNRSNLSGTSSFTCSAPPPSLNNYISTEDVTQGQNKSCIFSSGPPGRQISIKVNPALLNQENRQAFSNRNSQISTANKPRDCNINSNRSLAPPLLSKNALPTNYQHQLPTDKIKTRLWQPVQPNYQNNYFPQNNLMHGCHGPPANQQTVPPSLPAALQPLPAAQQPLPAASQPPPPALQPLTVASQPLPTASQPLPLHLSPTQPLLSAPPPSYDMASNWTYQAPLIMSQHNMDKQPMQSLQKESTEQQKTETNRSVSTDSGFTSPLHLNSPEPMSDPWAQDQQNMQPTPLITHVTSLNPSASYMVDGPCSICGITTKKKCIGCLKKYYCSYECQQADWYVHKHICKLP